MSIEHDIESLTVDVQVADTDNVIQSSVLTWLEVYSAIRGYEQTAKRRDRSQLEIPLAAILKQERVLLAWVEKVSILASDGYNLVLTSDLPNALDSATITLEQQSLDEATALPRVIRISISDGNRMFHVKKPVQIIVTIGPSCTRQESLRFYFMNNARFSTLISQGPRHTKMFRLEDMLANFELADCDISVLARDGLYRTFLSSAIKKQVLLVQNIAGTWDMQGESLVRGMRIREIFFMSFGQHNIFLKLLDSSEQDIWSSTFLDTLLQ